jgi:hypothetical protein
MNQWRRLRMFKWCWHKWKRLYPIGEYEQIYTYKYISKDNLVWVKINNEVYQKKFYGGKVKVCIKCAKIIDTFTPKLKRIEREKEKEKQEMEQAKMIYKCSK